MYRLSKWSLGVITLLFAVTTSGCWAFKATLPGTLDVRAELAQPEDAPLDPQMGMIGQPFYAGWTFTESNDPPTEGEYKDPPAGAHTYRKTMRSWHIIGLFPIITDDTKIEAELKEELAKPGAVAKKIRITSGFDIPNLVINIGAYLTYIIPPVGALVTAANAVLGMVHRGSEVVAFVYDGKAAPQPAPALAPAAEPPMDAPVGDDSTTPASE